MGITHDQHTRTHLNRLHRHYKAMEALKDDWRAQEEFELHAWAFSRVLITSDYMKHLLGHLIECHQFHTTIWDLNAEADLEKYPNTVPPIWALELVELILRASRLMAASEPNHNTEFYGASDALTMLEEWAPFGPQTNIILLAINEKDYQKWSGGFLNLYCWLGFPAFLKSA